MEYKAERLAELRRETDELRRDLEERRQRRLLGDEPTSWRRPEPEPRASATDLRVMALRSEMGQVERRLRDAITDAVADRALRETQEHGENS